MDSEGTRPPDGPQADDHGERAETYLRLLAEAVLRPAADADLGRISRAADVLVETGVLAEPTVTRILSDLQLSLRVRGRPEISMTSSRRRLTAGFGPVGPSPPGVGRGPAGPWRVLRATQRTPGSRLMALIALADMAVAPATLHFSPSAGVPEIGDPALTSLIAGDNIGNFYRLGFIDGTWAGSTWTGTILVTPAPPAAARRFDIIGPNGPVLRAEIAAIPPGGPAPGAAPRPVAESPGERLLTRRGEGLLIALAHGVHGKPGLSQSGLAELAGMLEAAGLLSPLSPAPARLAALGQLIGLPLEGPPSEVPARWTQVIAHYGRRRRVAPVTGTAAIGAVLPEIDGTRLAIAGVRSGGAGSFLYALAQGLPQPPRRRQPGMAWDAGFSLWARDDAGGWHLGAVQDVSPVGGPEAVLRLAMLPPLCRETGSLAIEIAGTGQRITATLAVRW